MPSSTLDFEKDLHLLTNLTHMNKALYIIISVFFLVWNLFGVFAFIVEMTASEMITDPMNDTQLEMYLQRPSWYLIFYGIAVFAGFIAAIMLLARRRQAAFFALLSLLGVIVTTGYNFYSGAADLVEGADQIFLIGVPLISVFMLVYARHADKKGMLK
jgi:hypothetical protein